MRGLCLFFLLTILVSGCSKQSAPIDTQRDKVQQAIELASQLEPGKVKQRELNSISQMLPENGDITDAGLQQSALWVKKAVAAAIANQPKQQHEFISHAQHRLILYDLAVRPPAPC